MSLPLKYLDKRERREMYQVSLGEIIEISVGECAKFQNTLSIKMCDVHLHWGFETTNDIYHCCLLDSNMAMCSSALCPMMATQSRTRGLTLGPNWC